MMLFAGKELFLKFKKGEDYEAYQTGAFYFGLYRHNVY